jgi:tRNA(Ile)-lysidine synthetase-like protein
MELMITPGTYVVAVSGGVDSMALLHALSLQPDLRLTVAHFDHGIRPDSAEDRRLVQTAAQAYGLPFVYASADLGPGTSEAAARKARYNFLHSVKTASGARGIITAHHRDDVLETAVLNILRGTKRKGLSALRSTDTIVRPLLHVPKQSLRDYAHKHNLQWREDSTNQDINYLRNYIRHMILPRLLPAQRAELLAIIKQAEQTNDQIDAHLINHLHVQLADDRLARYWFVQLPHAVAREVLHAWLRRHSIKNIDRKLLERVVVSAKTYRAGQRIVIDGSHELLVGKNELALNCTDR